MAAKRKSRRRKNPQNASELQLVDAADYFGTRKGTSRYAAKRKLALDNLKRAAASRRRARARKNPYTAKSSGITYFPEKCTVKSATKLMNKRKSQYLRGSKRRTAAIGTCGVRDAEFTIMLSNKRRGKRRSKKPITKAAALIAAKRKRTLAKARKLIGRTYSPKLRAEGKGLTAAKARARRARLAAGRKAKQLKAGKPRKARKNPTRVYAKKSRSGFGGMLASIEKALRF